MNWRDLFYFSKGERRALTVLLILIAASWLTLQLKDTKEDSITTKESNPPQTIIVTPPAKTTQAVAQQSTRSSTSSKGQANSIRKKPGFLAEEKRNASERKRTYTEKYPKGTVVEINSADTTTLKKVPGIGSTFARRIVKYRNLLGGFYTVTQLAEVYGIDEERYEAMKSWFTADPSMVCKLRVSIMSAKELSKHPYVSYRQARCIEQLQKQKGKLEWENLQLLEEFTKADTERLIPYLSFD